MTVQQLKYILKVAEVGSITEAAKLLPIVNSLADFGNYYKSLIEQN